MLNPSSLGIVINNDIVHDLLESLQGLTDSPAGLSDTRQAAGWILFLSLVVFIHQIFAIFQLFFYLKLLYIKIPVGKSLWYLFPLIVSAIYTEWVCA